MKKLLLIILVFLTIFGCAFSGRDDYKTKQKDKKFNNIIILPEWFFNLPDEDMVIGISLYETDIRRMIEAAKQDAAIQLTKNKSTIIISKRASIDDATSDELQSRELEYDIIGDKKLLWKNYERLSLIDSHILFKNYYIALFSTKPVKGISNKLISNNGLNRPAWFKAEGLVVNDKADIGYFATAEASSLISAYNTALQKGRIAIGQYLEKEIKAMDKTANYLTERVITEETIERLNNISAQKVFVTSKLQKGKLVYTVFIEMGTAK